MAELMLAALVLLACAGLLVHMLLPPARRRRLDEVVRAFQQLIGAVWLRTIGKSARRSGGKSGNKASAAAASQNKSRRSGVPRAVRLVEPPPPNLSKLEPKTPSSAQSLATASTDDGIEPVDAESEKAAEQEALDIIDRARRQARDGKPVDRDGNVYRPDAFKPREPRQPPHDKLH